MKKPEDEVIDVALWDQARWRGTAFGRGGPDSMLYVAIIFQNRDAAGEIFRSWHDRIGSVDTNELIRIAIIEGDIPGQDPGYTVHIGPNHDLLLGTARTSPTVERDQPAFTYFTRQLRLNNPQSAALATFKRDIAAEPRYLLIAGVLNETGSFDLNPFHTITKTAITFRQASEVSERNDPDSIVLARREGHGARWN